MPTVLRERGFDVRIFLNDHEPPHVHVYKGGTSVRIELETGEAEVAPGRRMTKHDVAIARQIVGARYRMLLDFWRQLHG